MTVSEQAFEILKSKYDSSWAIWALEERKVIRDSVCDMSVFDLSINEDLLEQLTRICHSSAQQSNKSGEELRPLENFHLVAKTTNYGCPKGVSILGGVHYRFCQRHSRGRFEKSEKIFERQSRRGGKMHNSITEGNSTPRG